MDISEIRQNNLKALIDEVGGRQEFIRRSGKAEAQIGQLLSNAPSSRNVGTRLAREFEEKFSKPKGWMDQPHGYSIGNPADTNVHSIREKSSGYTGGDEMEFVGHMDAWDSQTPLSSDEVELPLFREVELAAGSGQTQVIENHGCKLRFAKSTLSRANVLPEHAACAFIKGNSMEPVMPDGTTVGVNTADKVIADGKVYAIDHDGMLRVKYLYRRPGGGLKVVSANSVEHPTEEYTAEEVEQTIRIIGRVFWYSALL